MHSRIVFLPSLLKNLNFMLHKAFFEQIHARTCRNQSTYHQTKFGRGPGIWVLSGNLGAVAAWFQVLAVSLMLAVPFWHEYDCVVVGFCGKYGCCADQLVGQSLLGGTSG